MMGAWNSLRLWIYLILTTSFTAHLDSSTTFMHNEILEEKLVKALIPGSNINVRPAKNYGDIIHVRFHFLLNEVLQLEWIDPHLAWNPVDYDNIHVTHIPASSIWTPPFAIINSLSVGQEEEAWRQGMVNIFHNGRVQWTPNGIFTTLCDVDVYYFPFDTQTCSLEILQVYGYQHEAIYFGVKDASAVMGKQNGEWIVQEIEVSNSVMPGYNYSHITFTVTLRRQPTFHVLNTIVPLLLLFVVGLMVFPLPVDSGEKVSLCVACLMSFFIMQLVISQEIPRNWKSLPIVLVFNSVFMFLNALSICVTVLVLNLHHRHSVSDIPKWLEKLLGSRWRNWLQKKGIQVRALTLKKTEDVTPDDKAEITKNYDARKGDNEEKKLRFKWRVIAEAVNNVLCAVYIFAGVVTTFVCFVLWYHG